MKRLQRKVRDSEQSTVSENQFGTLTFDRRTFLECSSRMKRLVPTLRRRQINECPVSTLQASQDETESTFTNPIRSHEDVDGLSTSEECEETTDTSKIHSTTEVFKSTCGAQHQKSSKRVMLVRGDQSNIKPIGIDVTAAIGTLPSSTTTKIIATPSGCISASATLPTSMSPPKQKRPMSRRIWLKPLTSFVAFMSNIGDNIHITSYPTP